jgi:diguanylate cyclase (GGDEF)-like protein
LREVAAICRTLCVGRDLVGRLGGEEFALLLVGRDLASGLALARECRRLIAAIDTSGSGHAFVITASFGVAGSRQCGHSCEALLAKADDALYRAKREGRDRVSVFTGSVEDAQVTSVG